VHPEGDRGADGITDSAASVRSGLVEHDHGVHGHEPSAAPAGDTRSGDRAPRPERGGRPARHRGKPRLPGKAAARNGQAGEGPGRAPGSAPAGRAAGEPVYGALDLGTNNCRLLIARRTREGFRVIDAYSRIVRLGEGLGATGRLGDAAMERAVEALKICADKMTRRGVTRARTIATEACRMAGNGRDFIERVRVETGLTLDIVSTEDEARLAVAGCAPLLDRNCGSALVFDIGGGSTELIWVTTGQAGERADKGRIRPRIEDWTSLSCGVVTLAERHGGVDVPGAVYERMVDEVSERIEPFMARLRAGGGAAPAPGGFHLLGTSGTVTTIAGVHLGLPRYDRNRVDGAWITPGDVRQVTRHLLDMNYETRAAHPCVGRERADLVLAGCAIFEAIARAWPAERLRVADRGLREGILLSLIEADSGRQRRRRRRRRRSARPAQAERT
jgi:exopolyphosphatase/guanosine-5'-triphosphate,3'-diphosphate pyrophosphatase